jgi:glycosyltransferase involved in cell wall biosynthesis
VVVGHRPWLVLDLHNVESALRARDWHGWTPWGRLRQARDVAATRQQERRAAEWADRIWVCSAEEAERFAAATGRRKAVHVVPNGIPRAETVPAEMRPKANPAERAPVLLFAGHLAYKPNMKAAEFAARRIMPLLSEQVPGARLILAGRTPHERVKRLAGTTTEIVADPPDMSPLLWRADFAILPIPIGGGTRIKALEAMAWGLPLVASAVAVDGLDLEDGRHVRLATGADDYAAAIAELWSNGKAFERLRAEARDHAVRQFAPDAIVRAIGQGLGRA